MCGTSLRWRHLVNAYGVKAWCGCLEPLSAACIWQHICPCQTMLLVVLGLRASNVALYCVSAVVMLYFAAVCLRLNKVDYYYYYSLFLSLTH